MKQVPAVLQYIAGILRTHSSKILVASSTGLEGEAAVVAIAHVSEREGQDLYHAVVALQHCYHILQVR